LWQRVPAALLPSGATVAERTAEAQRYFNLNFPATYMGIARPTPIITIAAGSVEVKANTNVPTTFMKMVGRNDIPADSKSNTLIAGRNVDYDLVMVVDESGSTGLGCAACGGLTRMQVEKNAISAMMNTVFPPGPINDNVRFGLIGYTGFISNKWGLTSDKNQALASIASLASRVENYDHWGMEAGFNMVTGNVDSSLSSGTIVPNNPNVYQFPPLALVPVASFNPAKLCWTSTGWRNVATVADCVMQAIERNTNVPPPRTPRSDGAPVSPVKNVVFITDGFIMVEPPGCPARPCYSDFLAQCTALKNAGVNVFVISFASQGGGDVAALSSCASVDPVSNNPRYWFAPNAASLNTILQNIGVTINKVRIFQ
jgi:hypothetical protein